MKDRIAVVSGAAQGIGAAVAAALAQRGALVAALDVQTEGLQRLVQQYPGRIHAQVVDLRASAAVDTAVAAIEQQLGPVDMLASVAGILRLGPVCALSDADWEDTFAVNVHGVFYLTRAVARRMRSRQRGSIVTVASNAASVPRQEMAAYAASKAAVRQYTRCLGLELAGHGIRCNSVSPGSTDTAMQRQLWQSEQDVHKVIEGSLASYRNGIPLRRIASPDDIAAAVLFLLGEEARHVTLQDLCVDGGATLGA